MLKATSSQRKEYFKFLGTEALFSVLRGDITLKQANESLLMLRKLHENKINHKQIEEYFRRHKMLKGLDLSYLK